MGGFRKEIWLVVALIALALSATAQEATPLTLTDGVKMTRANNPMHKAALADTKAASAGVREARAPLLPRITVQAFYGVLLAEKQVVVAEDAVKTVEAIEQQSRARVESGMAVDSDLLSAQVQSSARQQELIERRNQLALAQTRLALARGAIAQADESLRINQNRYEGGLSTVTDILRVDEAAHRAKADYWQAVYRRNASYAGVELAAGTLTVDSLAVTQ